MLDEDALFSVPLPDPAKLEPEHGFTDSVLTIEYAMAHAPTWDAGLALAATWERIGVWEDMLADLRQELAR
jgi:hypothetical protein